MSDQQLPYPYEPEFSVKKLLKDRWGDVKYILSFKKYLAIVLIAGAAIGALTAYFWTPSYTAHLTFVIDDSKTSGGGGLAALAGQFGFNLDGIGGGSGVLAGDNVQELLKSQKLIKETLMSPYNATGSVSLADKYAEVNKLNKKWLKYSPDGRVTRFPVNVLHYTRLQDSLLHEMTALILEKDFGVDKADKKLSFFEVNTTMKDELLAQLFCTRLIKNATNFYITTKTTRLRNNVNRLQHRADSIGSILNRKTYAVSSANQVLLDLNPAYTTTNANIEVKERDKIVLSTIYSETVKNLEASKTMLAQETPTVTIVDEPELPLKKNTLKYSFAIAGGMIIGAFLFSIFIVLFRKKETEL